MNSEFSSKHLSCNKLHDITSPNLANHTNPACPPHGTHLDHLSRYILPPNEEKRYPSHSINSIARETQTYSTSSSSYPNPNTSLCFCDVCILHHHIQQQKTQIEKQRQYIQYQEQQMQQMQQNNQLEKQYETQRQQQLYAQTQANPISNQPMLSYSSKQPFVYQKHPLSVEYQQRSRHILNQLPPLRLYQHPQNAAPSAPSQIHVSNTLHENSTHATGTSKNDFKENISAEYTAWATSFFKQQPLNSSHNTKKPQRTCDRVQKDHNNESFKKKSKYKKVLLPVFIKIKSCDYSDSDCDTKDEKGKRSDDDDDEPVLVSLTPIS